MNQSLTQANVMSSMRYLITASLSFAAGKGYISSDMATNMGVLALAALPLVWGIYANYAKEQGAQIRETVAVRAGVAMAQDGGAGTPPSAISPAEAQTVIASYAPIVK
jgi:hypothetical protein